MPAALQRLRDRLDAINREILALAQERGALVLEVASLKDALGLDSYDPRREAEMLRDLTTEPDGPFSSEELGELFRALFAVSLTLQRRSRHAGKATAPEAEEPPASKIRAIRR